MKSMHMKALLNILVGDEMTKSEMLSEWKKQGCWDRDFYSTLKDLYNGGYVTLANAQYVVSDSAIWIM